MVKLLIALLALGLFPISWAITIASPSVTTLGVPTSFTWTFDRAKDPAQVYIFLGKAGDFLSVYQSWYGVDTYAGRLSVTIDRNIPTSTGGYQLTVRNPARIDEVLSWSPVFNLQGGATTTTTTSSTTSSTTRSSTPPPSSTTTSRGPTSTTSRSSTVTQSSTSRTSSTTTSFTTTPSTSGTATSIPVTTITSTPTLGATTISPGFIDTTVTFSTSTAPTTTATTTGGVVGGSTNGAGKMHGSLAAIGMIAGAMLLVL